LHQVGELLQLNVKLRCQKVNQQNAVSENNKTQKNITIPSANSYVIQHEGDPLLLFNFLKMAPWRQNM
jgi:hypothetical protein